MRRRSADCPSDLKLDRWLAGELTPAEQRGVEAHVEACAACGLRHAELAEAQRSFVREVPAFAMLAVSAPAQVPSLHELRSSSHPEVPTPDALGAPSSPQRGRVRWRAGISALAAAAVIALAIGRPWSSLSSSDAALSGTRTKGGLASFGWVVRRGEHVFNGRADRALRAGDALRFSVSARERVFVAILGRDATGQLSVYYPDGEQLTPIEAGRDRLLPVAIELDAAVGEEQLYGVFCTSPVRVSDVRIAIRRSPDLPAAPGGCSIERQAFSKESP